VCRHAESVVVVVVSPPKVSSRRVPAPPPSPRIPTAQAALLPLSEEVLMWCGEVSRVVRTCSDRASGGLQVAEGWGSKQEDWHVSPLLPKRLEPLELRGAPTQLTHTARALHVTDSPGFLEVPPLPVQVHPQAASLSLSLSLSLALYICIMW